ncbi:hypothetical protein DV736_g3097, partial [Chaetothyriales sp. CBS 134916]
MLTIAEVSGLIAAAVMIIQYVLPAALVVILVKYAGTENRAGTWSVVNRTISTTIWPHLLRADAVKMHHVPLLTKIASWGLTLSAFPLVVASVFAPLGLRDEIVPRESRLVQFEYVPDRSPWGRVTMPRPSSKFTRNCEFGLIINCPGQYQGVYMNETEPGHWESVETNADSTINLTIPENYTAMFSSATSNLGSTVSGLFDIQYRRWRFDRWAVMDKGQPFVKGASRYIQILITQERILLVEGLVVDMRNNPGIGFRNHTIPVGLEHGGTWTEDLTWIEPVTRCADTNLSIQFRQEITGDNHHDDVTFSVLDRGAFTGLDVHTLESPAWIDNQTLDLSGRAHKAARMHNVLVASSLNVTLPFDPATKTMSAMAVEDTNSASPYMFSYQPFDMILLDELSGVGGAPPNITGFTHSNKYPDGSRRLVALNYSAIAQVCRGYYELHATDNDYRANNITYPLVQCGIVLGAQLQDPNSNLSVSTYDDRISTYSKNLYVCASSVRASIKSVDFRYNGTRGQLENLEATEIRDKVYPDEQSKPLWAVESSWPKAMRFDPLWGIIDRRFEEFGGFNSLRAEKLWLPASPFLTSNFGETEGYDALASASGFSRRLGNLYGGLSELRSPDYSGQYEYTLLERWHRLSQNEDMASQIPSLVMTDGLAAALVGTKTSISQRYVEYPASLAVDDTVRAYPQAQVTIYKRVIHYDIRYAIPSFVVLAIFLLAVLWALAILLTSRLIIWTIQNMYNQTSTSRLAINLLRPGRSDPKQSTSKWMPGDGSLLLSFGRMSPQEKDYFCTIVNDTAEIKQSPNGNLAKTPSSLGIGHDRDLTSSEGNNTLIAGVPKHDSDTT